MSLVRVYTSAGKLPSNVRLLDVFKAFGALVKRSVKSNCRSKGGRHFWNEVADATRIADVSESSVTVENTHVAAAQKQFGGIIEAKNAQALTIPISDLARGRRAGEFTALVKVRTKEGKTFLGRMGGRGKSKRFEPLYVLVKRTAPQRPDPFWPDDVEAVALLQSAVRLGMNYLA